MKYRITKSEWDQAGGFENPRLSRRMTAGGRWLYYREG